MTARVARFVRPLPFVFVLGRIRVDLAKVSFAYCGEIERVRGPPEREELASWDPRGPKNSIGFRIGATVQEILAVEVPGGSSFAYSGRGFSKIVL